MGDMQFDERLVCNVMQSKRIRILLLLINNEKRVKLLYNVYLNTEYIFMYHVIWISNSLALSVPKQI